mmetsp:Transcript_65403/g.184189  ORF Transcript_65403/g.184189 Transcript_65403/m.184189 type:complete len:217 (+) Transcript_65403:155-805(+)
MLNEMPSSRTSPTICMQTWRSDPETPWGTSFTSNSCVGGIRGDRMRFSVVRNVSSNGSVTEVYMSVTFDQSRGSTKSSSGVPAGSMPRFFEMPGLALTILPVCRSTTQWPSVAASRSFSFMATCSCISWKQDAESHSMGRVTRRSVNACEPMPAACFRATQAASSRKSVRSDLIGSFMASEPIRTSPSSSSTSRDENSEVPALMLISCPSIMAAAT